MTRTCIRLTVALLTSVLWLAATTSPAIAQEAQTSGRVPLSHLYWFFLRHQEHLDKEADARQQKGKDGTWLRDHHKARLGFDDAEFQKVRQSADRLDKRMKKIDDEVAAIVNDLHTKYSPDTTRELPPIPKRLLELKDEREATINDEVKQLRAALRKENVKKLEDYLETDFAPNVKFQHLRPPDQNPQPGRGNSFEVQK